MQAITKARAINGPPTVSFKDHSLHTLFVLFVEAQDHADMLERIHLREEHREIRQKHKPSPEIEAVAAQEFVIEIDVAFARGEKPGDALQEGAFSRAIQTQHRHDPAGGELFPRLMQRTFPAIHFRIPRQLDFHEQE